MKVLLTPHTQGSAIRVGIIDDVGASAGGGLYARARPGDGVVLERDAALIYIHYVHRLAGQWYCEGVVNRKSWSIGRLKDPDAVGRPDQINAIKDVD